MTEYLKALDGAIVTLHGCEGVHIKTVPVKEVFKGKVAWEGEVEVFALSNDSRRGHPVAKHCYAWGYPKDNGKGWEITTVLELPPVTSPQTAVKASIAARAQQARN